MKNIDAEKIFDVISFLEYNEQYGDDWHDEIAELRKVIDDAFIMEDIDVEKICDVITFLQDNEQYGDDWRDEIAELYDVIDAIEGLMK